MKQIFKYILIASVALSAIACQKEQNLALDEGDTNEGCVRFNIAMSNQTRAEQTRPEDVIVRVYEVSATANKLIRVYQAWDEIPSELYLIEGNYKVAVEAGDKFGEPFKASSLDQNTSVLSQLYYTGAKSFAVTKGVTTPVTVTCLAQNVKLDVVFNEADGENARISDTAINVALGDNSLSFAGSDSCYFMIPEDENGEALYESISWGFTGVHTAKDGTVTDINKSGVVAVEKGKAYSLKFVFSKSPDGTIVLTLMVEQTVQGYDDVISFKPQPEFAAPTGGMTAEGDVLTYLANQSVNTTLQSINPIKSVSVKVGTGDYTQIWSNDDEASTRVADNFEFVVEDEGKKILITINPAFFAQMSGGLQNFTFKAEDVNGGVGDNKVEFINQGLEIGKTTSDLWLNTAKFNAVVTDAATPSVKVQFRKKGSSDWAVTPAGTLSSGNVFTVTSVAAWDDGVNDNGKTVYYPNSNKSIFANSTYECQLVVNDVAYGPIEEYTTAGGQTIPYATFEDSNLSCWGTSNDSAPYWGSGNNTFTSKLCTRGTREGQQGNSCAVLDATYASGMLAAGNLFTGTFKFEMLKTSGTVSFGVDYDWQSRPSAIKLKIHHKITNATDKKHSHDKEISTDGKTPDEASVYCCIIDWNEQHKVVSGLSSPSGVWSPENGANAVSAGKIIGYGAVYPTGTTGNDENGPMEEMIIPIKYYDKVTKPTKQYKLIIAAATSRYGDYANGSQDNVMYIDDFQWVY